MRAEMALLVVGSQPPKKSIPDSHNGINSWFLIINIMILLLFYFIYYYYMKYLLVKFILGLKIVIIHIWKCHQNNWLRNSKFNLKKFIHAYEVFHIKETWDYYYVNKCSFRIIKFSNQFLDLIYVGVDVNLGWLVVGRLRHLIYLCVIQQSSKFDTSKKYCCTSPLISSKTSNYLYVHISFYHHYYKYILVFTWWQKTTHVGVH